MPSIARLLNLRKNTIHTTDTAQTGATARTNVSQSTPARAMMQTSSGLSDSNNTEVKEHILGDLTKAKQYRESERNFFQSQTSQFTKDLIRGDNPHKLDKQITEEIDIASNAVKEEAELLKEIQETQQGVIDETISPAYAKQLVKRLLPEQSKPSKYEQAHLIELRNGEVTEPSTKAEMNTRHFYFDKKGVPSTQNALDVSQNHSHSPQIGANLSSIPVDNAALSGDVNHTKIILASHGAEEGGALVIDSPLEEEIDIVSPELLAQTLMEQLPKGNYHSKLTIAVNACNAGKENEGGGSVINSLAKILHSNGYSGIKITGPNTDIITAASSYGPRQSGDLLVEDGESYEKYSAINAKKTAYTDK